MINPDSANISQLQFNVDYTDNDCYADHKNIQGNNTPTMQATG